MQCDPVLVSVVGGSVVYCAGGLVSGSCLLIRRSRGVSIRRSSGSDWGGVYDLEVSVCCADSVLGSVLSSCCCSWW